MSHEMQRALDQRTRRLREALTERDHWAFVAEAAKERIKELEQKNQELAAVIERLRNKENDT